MKISIVTVYNSHNFGSFLQAKSLSQVLSEYGNVSFYDSRSRKLLKPFLRKSKKILKTSQNALNALYGIWFEFAEMIRLKKAWRSLSVNKNFNDIDAVFLGSDEIWNVTRKACRYPVYWGHGITTFKAAYAPSVNNTTVEDLEKYREYIDDLRGIDALSVRDSHSKSVIDHFSRRSVPVVLDPTLLNPPEDIEFKYDKPYIAVYLFYGALSDGEISSIRHFAKEKELPLISAGQHISWCDMSVHSKGGNPFYIFKNAEYVITNTFHGTAYAINYNTRFAAFIKGKTKTEELAGMFGLSSRIVSDGQPLDAVLETDIDYKDVNKKLNALRKDSFDYIYSTIKTFSMRGDMQA